MHYRVADLVASGVASRVTTILLNELPTKKLASMVALLACRGGVRTFAAAVGLAGRAKQDSGSRTSRTALAQGIKSGQLTAAGTSNLRGKESAINQEVKNRPHLERRQADWRAKNSRSIKQQNKLIARNIYNGQAQRSAPPTTGNNEVGYRAPAKNQQNRIANGIACGQDECRRRPSKVEKGRSRHQSRSEGPTAQPTEAR